MKKAGIFAAVIAVVLIFLQLYSYKLAGYTPEAVYKVPETALASELSKGEETGTDTRDTDIPASLELKRLEASSPYYKRGKALYLGEEKEKAGTGYPLYKEDGAGVYAMSDSMTLVNTEFDTLPSYEWLYLSGGMSFNQDGSQADPDEFILMGLSGGLYLNTQKAVITGRAGNRIAAVKENSIVLFGTERIGWYEFDNGRLSYGDCTQLFDADITIGSVTMKYTEFLKRLNLLQEEGADTKKKVQETEPLTEPSTELVVSAEETKTQEPGGETASEPETAGAESVPPSPEPETEEPEVLEPTTAKGEETSAMNAGETNPFFPKGNATSKEPGKKDKDGSGSSHKGDSGSGSKPEGGTSATGPTYDDPWGVPGEGDGGEGEGEGDGGAEFFRMPKVTVGAFTMGVYTASTTLTIEDEDTRIMNGVRLVIYRDGRVYMRKLIKASGPVTLDPLPPDTEFEIEGFFDYSNRDNGKETFYYLKRQYMPEKTKKVEELNKLLFTFGDGGKTRYADRLSVTDMKLSEEQKLPPATPGDATPGNSATGNTQPGASVSYPVLPYIQRLDMVIKKKVMIGGGTWVQSVDSGILNQLKNGNTRDWLTQPVLDSNAAYSFEFQFFDRFGNQLCTIPSPVSGEGKTSKRQPKAQIQFERNAPVGQQPVTVTMNNKDSVEFFKQNSTGGYDGVKTAYFYMVEADDLLNPIELDVTGNGDKVRYVDVSSVNGRQSTIHIYGLPAGHVYYGIVAGSYDLDDGSFYADQEIGRAAFTTSDLSSLGSVNYLVKAQNVTSGSANIQAYLRTAVNKPLIPFIRRVEVILSNQDTGEVYRTISLNKEVLDSRPMTEREYVVEDTTGTSGPDQFGEQTVISLSAADGTMTAWDALLSNGTIKINFPDKSMKSNTPYLVSIRSYAKQDVEGAREEEVTGRYFTGSFKTLKKTPVVTYQNMLVTNNFARIYGMRISDPDGVIKNGAVSAMLVMSENGKTVSLEASTVNKINAMDSYNFNNLSNRVKYELKLYAIEYNEGFSSSSAMTNVQLKANPQIAFETGTTINGSLDISGLLENYGGVYMGRNLFDPNDAKLNSKFNADGSVSYVASSSTVSDFIPVSDQKIYLFSGCTGNAVVYYYDENKNSLNMSTAGTYIGAWRLDEPVSGAAYVRLAMNKGDLNAVTYCELDKSLFAADSPSNLYDPSTAVVGRVIESNGTESANSAYFSTDYIKVTPGKFYEKTGILYGDLGTMAKRIAFYDKDKNIILYRTLTFGDGTYQAPDNAAYVRISSVLASKDKLYFGEVPTDLFGKNLFDSSLDIVDGYYLASNNSVVENTSCSYSASYIPVEAGAVYYRSNFAWDTFYYDKNKTFIGSVLTSGPTCFIPPENAAYIRVNYNNTMNNALLIYRVMPSAGANEMAAKLSVNISDKESYLQGHPYYWTLLEKELEDGSYQQVEARKCDVAVIDGKVQPVSAYQEFDVERDSGYRAVMKVDLFDQKDVLLDQAEFRTAKPCAKSYIIRSEAGLAAISSDPYGTYMAVEDIVNSTPSLFSSNMAFWGVLDFQGHSLTRTGTNSLFYIIEEKGVVKNMVLHGASTKRQSDVDNYGYLAYENKGFIKDVVADFNVNLYGNKVSSGGLCNVNSITGVIENFAITLLDDFSAGGNVGLVTALNRGIVRNGYVYDNGAGYKMDTSINSASVNVIVNRGGIVGSNDYPGLIENVYSLVDADITTPVNPTIVSVGAVVGTNSGTVRNVFTTADAMNQGIPLEKFGPAVGNYPSNALYDRMENIQYVRLKEHIVECYKNTYNREADKSSLLDPDWYESAVNKSGAYDTSIVVSGYYPRLKMSEQVYNAQPLIPLPSSVKPQIPTLTSAAVKEQREKDGGVELIFMNPQKIPVRDVTISYRDNKGVFTKAMDCRVTDQWEKEDGTYAVTITAENPTAFYSLYHVNGFTIQNGSSSTDVIPVDDQTAPVYLEFYEDITDLAGWLKIAAKPDANYRIKADLDFGSVTDAQMPSYFVRSMTGKIDGGYEDENGYHISTLKNLRLTQGSLFFSVNGGIKNLKIDGMEASSTNLSAAVALVDNLAAGYIDNVQVKNAVLKGGYRIAGIAGTVGTGVMTNCSVTDSYIESIRSRSQVSAGGLVGVLSLGKIQNSFVSNITINIKSAVFVDGAGGICGRVDNAGQLNTCYAEGTLMTNYSNSGGIVGSLSNNGSYWIYNNISIMDLVTNGSGYSGGIAGNVAGGNGFKRNLSVGNIYSASQDPVFFHRIVGYRTGGTGQTDNLAYSGQMLQGGIDPSNTDDAAALVSSDELKIKETYTSRMSFSPSDYEFSYSDKGKPMGIEQGYLPLLKNSRTGELLENQIPHRVSQTGVTLKVESMGTNASPQKDFEQIFGQGAVQDFGDGRLYQLRFYVESENPYVILEADMDGMDMNADHHYNGVTKRTYEESAYVTGEGKNRISRRYPFLSSIYAFDRYLLAVKATPAENVRADGTVIDENKVVSVSASFDLKEEDKSTFQIANAVEWNSVMSRYGQIYGNFELTGDIDASSLPAGETLVTGVKVNRLYSTKEEGVTIKNVTMKTDTFADALILEVTSGVRYVNFENITVDNSAITSANRYVGVIGLMWGAAEHVKFNQVTVKGNGDYIGCIGYSGGTATDVELKNINVSGIGSYHGGLAGYLYEGNNITATGTISGDIYEYSISGTGYVGGLVGGINRRLSNVWAEGIRVSATGVNTNYTGGLCGFGNVNNGMIEMPERYSSIKNSVITSAGGNVGGATGNGAVYYVEVDSCSIAAAGSTVGGVNGTSAGVKELYVRNSIVTGNKDVGGIMGWGNGTQLSAGAVENCVISGKTYVGGIAGRGGSNRATVSNCVITAETSYAGGVAGGTWGGTLRTNVVNCRITGNSYVGGLFGGGVSGNSQIRYSGVENSVIRSGRMTSEGNWASYAGGIIGEVHLGVDMGYNSVDDETTVDGEGDYVGGLTGYASGGIYAFNAIGAQVNQSEEVKSYSRYAGGLAGGVSTYGPEASPVSNSKTQMNNSYFSGNVKGTNYVGGLIGVVQPSSEPGAPKNLEPDKFYSLIMAGTVTAEAPDIKPVADFSANMADPSADLGTIGYLRIYDESRVNGTPAAAAGLEYLGKAADSTKACLVSFEQLTDRATYFNAYADNGLAWSPITNWSDQGLLKLYGTELKAVPDTGDGTKLLIYGSGISDGTYDAVVEAGYVEAGLKLEYDGINNTRKGHDPNARVWENLAGNESYDLKPDKLNFDLVQTGTAVTGHDGWTDKSYVITNNNVGLATANRGWESENTRGFYTDMTMTATFKSNFSGTGVFAGFGNWGQSNANANLGIENWRLIVATGAVERDPIPYTTNVIHNVTAVFNAEENQIYFYVDGVLKSTFGPSSGSWTKQIFSANFRAMVAANGYTFRGELFNTKLYTRTLTQPEVMQNYQVDLQRFGDNGAVSASFKGISSGVISSDAVSSGASSSGTASSGIASAEETAKVGTVIFKDGKAVLDTAILGLTGQESKDIKVWILPAGQGTATDSNASADVLMSGAIYGFRYGQEYLDYTEVRDEDGRAVPMEMGMYRTNTAPTAVLPAADRIKWYRSSYPGYNGGVVEGNGDLTETLAGRGYYYAEVTKGAVTYLTPLILVETDAYMPYLRDVAIAPSYLILNGQEGYETKEQEEVILPDTYSPDGSHKKTEVPEWMKKSFMPYDTTDKWISGGHSIQGSSVIMLDQAYPEAVSLNMESPDLSELSVYPSGVSTVNIELGESGLQGSALTVYMGDKMIGSTALEQRVYTVNYDYESMLKLVVSAKGGAVSVKEYSPGELRRTVMTWKDQYYYLNGGAIDGNGDVPEGDCLHLFGGKALMADGTILNLDGGEIQSDHKAATSEREAGAATAVDRMEILPATVPLHETVYDGCIIKTYEHFSEVEKDGQTTVRELKLLANKGRLFALDTADTISGSVLADEYMDQVYMGMLENGGSWQNQGDALKVPSGIPMTGIAHTSETLDSSQPWLLFRYENGLARGFNYVTGEALEINNPKSDQSLLRYAGGYLSSKWESWFGDRKEEFADVKELEKELTVYPLDDTMLIDGDRAGAVEDGMVETEFAVDNDGALSDGEAAGGGSADEEGRGLDDGGEPGMAVYGAGDGSSMEDGSVRQNGGEPGAMTDSSMNSGAGEESLQAAGRSEDSQSGDSQLEENQPENSQLEENQPENSQSVESPKAKKPMDGRQNTDPQNGSVIAGTSDMADNLSIDGESDHTSSGDYANALGGDESKVPENTNTAAGTRYVYVYNAAKGGYNLYKTADLLLKDEKDLISEEEKLDQLQNRGLLANLNQVEQTQQKAAARDSLKGLVVFAATAVTALILAGYVVRRKRKL